MALSENGHGSHLDLQIASNALDKGNVLFAGEVVNRALTQDPNDVEALLMATRVLIDGGKSAIALAIAEKARTLAPNDHRTWLMTGAAETSLQRPVGIKALEHALSLSPDNPAVLRTLAHACVIGYRFEEAERYARSAIELDPKHPQAHAALAFSLLHKRDWGKGWDEYAFGMGHQQWREIQDYGLKEYQGKGPVLVYAEQGLGDQIAYCSTALDAQVSEVVCHPKLKNLLERSLGVEVYGDQFKKEIDWKPKGEFQVSMSGLQRFHRRKPEDFPQKPYLKPHLYKKFECKALLRALGKRPKVGIAWTGGQVGSAGYASRNLTLEQLLPILKLDADFICLEYKDRADELCALEEAHGITIHDWEWRTRSEDLDDVAALISGLDAIVTVPTTAYHIAGGLGVKAFVAVHATPYFHEGLDGSFSPWWGETVEFFRRTSLGNAGCVERIKNALEAHLERLR